MCLSSTACMCQIRTMLAMCSGLVGRWWMASVRCLCDIRPSSILCPNVLLSDNPWNSQYQTWLMYTACIVLHMWTSCAYNYREYNVILVRFLLMCYLWILVGSLFSNNHSGGNLFYVFNSCQAYICMVWIVLGVLHCVSSQYKRLYYMLFLFYRTHTDHDQWSFLSHDSSCNLLILLLLLLFDSLVCWLFCCFVSLFRWIVLKVVFSQNSWVYLTFWVFNMWLLSTTWPPPSTQLGSIDQWYSKTCSCAIYNSVTIHNQV